jgi:hypothetical protein
MVDYCFPRDAARLFAPLRGSSIVVVHRQVLLSDYDELPAETRDEESDGPTELVFDNGSAIHFVPDTEQMSVKVGAGNMPTWGNHFRAVEPTRNSFWSRRIGRPVSEVHVLVSKYAEPGNRSEFAVEFQLDGGLRVLMEYVSDEAHPDTLRLSGDEPAGTYRRVKVA